MIKLNKMRYVYFAVWMTFISSASLGSNMSQFGGGRPVHLFDKCVRSIPGYSIDTDIYAPHLLAKYFATGSAYSISLCDTSSHYKVLGFASGAWVETGSASKTNCYTSAGYYCFFKNDNY